MHITRPARAALADGHLIVCQDDGETRIPLEDIAYVVVDDMRVSLTAALIATCMEAGVALVTTDSRHTPSGLTLPFHRHHRQAGVAACQVGAGAPLKKRMWQAIVRSKIENQAAHLVSRGHPDGHALKAMAATVASGDTGNVEARAARYYWQRMFRSFVRDDPADLRNKALNLWLRDRARLCRARSCSGGPAPIARDSSR